MSAQPGTTAPATSTSTNATGAQPAENVVAVESLVIKCLNGHDSNVIGIVLAPECRKPTRLVCLSCLTGDYSDYVKFIVPFTNIKNGAFRNLENLPIDKSLHDINEVVKTIKDPAPTADPIDEYFTGIKKRITEAIDRFQRDYQDYVKRTTDKTQEMMKALRAKWADVMNFNDVLISIKDVTTSQTLDSDKAEKQRLNDIINDKVGVFLKDLMMSQKREELEKYFSEHRMDLRFYQFKNKNDENIKTTLETMLDNIQKLNLMMLSSFLPKQPIDMKFDVPEVYRRNVEVAKFQKNVFRVKEKGAIVSWPLEQKLHYVFSFKLTGKIDKPFFIQFIEENEYDKWPHDFGTGINVRELKANKEMKIDGGEQTGTFNQSIVENYYKVEFSHAKSLFSIRDMTSDINFVLLPDVQLKTDLKRIILASSTNITIEIFDVSLVSA